MSLSGNYLDQSTSSVQATLLLKNLESGLLSRVLFESERLSAGGVSFDYTISIIDVYPYSLDDPADIARLPFEILAVVLFVGLIGVEIYDFRSQGWRKYVSFANCVDLLSYALMCCALLCSGPLRSH